MSKQFIIKPLEGIEWEHKAMVLGASQSSIIEILGWPDGQIQPQIYGVSAFETD